MTVRSALVTGASRGIGEGVARRLATDGFGLTITARSQADLDELAPTLLGLGSPHVEVVAADLGDRESVAPIADAHKKAFGTMSALVLNAGVGSYGTIDSYNMSRFDKTVEVNFRAPFVLLQYVLPLLREAALEDSGRGARVIVLASVTGVHAERGLAAYGATKAAVISLAEVLNVEEAAHGVSATAIAPGFVSTDMASWAEDRVPRTEMIPVSDVVDVVQMLTGLSSRTMLSKIVMTRSGSTGYEA